MLGTVFFCAGNGYPGIRFNTRYQLHTAANLYLITVSSRLMWFHPKVTRSWVEI